MSDLIEEIKRDISEEKYAQIFTKHGQKLIFIGFFIVALTAVNYVYKNISYKKSIEIGNKFMEVFDEPKTENFAPIIAENQKGYSPLAILLKAGTENSTEKYDDALKTLQQLAENKNYDRAFKEMASINIAYLMMAKKEPKEKILEILNKVTSRDSVFRATALELKANYLLEIGDKNNAVTILNELAKDEKIPSTIQDRAKQVLTSIYSQLQ